MTTVVAAADPQNADLFGFGWRFTRLDLEVTIHPEETKITVAATAGLRLDIEASMGPTLAVNARKQVMQWTRLDAPPGAMGEINKAITPEPPADTDGEDGDEVASGGDDPSLLLWPPARLANIRFDQPLPRGTELEVSFAYESTDNTALFHVSSELAIASWVECWYPVPAERPDNPDVAQLPLAIGTTRIHMPKSWRSVSDGAFLKREETDTGAIETWQVTVPVKRSFAAGPYEVVRQRVGEREVGVYLLSPRPTAAQEQAEALARSIAALEERFGPYPYPGYAIVEVPDELFNWYAASQPSCILAQSMALEFTEGNLPVFAHEAAHGWWGNLVTPYGPGGILCSESLAQYGAVIVIEAVEGKAAATEFLRFSRPGYNPEQCARGYFEMCARGEDMPLSQLGDGGWQHDLSYVKGHWVFHMLRHRVGDEVFFRTLRELIGAFTNRLMSLDELRGAFIKAAPPEAQLERFFKQWLDRRGAPILDLEWQDASVPGKHQAQVTIRQAQKGDPYHLLLDVAIDAPAGPQLHTVEVSARETQVTLEAQGKPTGVRLDPDHRLLIWTPEYGARPAVFLSDAPQVTPGAE